MTDDVDITDHSFRAGQHVRRVAFVDCFGLRHPEVRGLTIVDVHDAGKFVRHTRVKAIGADSLGYQEGATRFFRHQR